MKKKYINYFFFILDIKIPLKNKMEVLNKFEENSNKILSIIESQLLKGNSNIIRFSNNLIKNIKSQFSIFEIKELIKKNFEKKQIYFIRHAEAEHNVLENLYYDNPKLCDVYDSKLTEEGKIQTKETLKKLIKSKINFDLVFISPLTRTIQTFILLKDYFKDTKTKIIITDMVKELVSYCNKNKGMKLTDLKIFLKQNNLDFDINYITKEFWWFDDGKDKENEYEGDNFPLRLQLFILWVCFRKENNILIISHSHVHSQIQGKGIYNADFKQLDNEYLFNF